MSSYGTSVNTQAGATVPVNGAALFPSLRVDDPATALMKVMYMQFLTSPQFLRKALDLGLDREDAVEAYYNIAATPWLGVTLDLQVVEPRPKKTLRSSGQLEDVGTAVIGALRAFVQF